MTTCLIELHVLMLCEQGESEGEMEKGREGEREGKRNGGRKGGSEEGREEEPGIEFKVLNARHVF